MGRSSGNRKRSSARKKGKQASASEGGLRGKTEKQASASEGGKIPSEKENQSIALTEGAEDLRTEGAEILRRKKEMWESYELPLETELLGMRLRMEQAGAGETTTKRKTKVIKKLLPQESIDYMISKPHPIIGKLLTDEELAKHDKGYREAYTKCKAKSEKVRAYYQAIIDQYNANGCAYDYEEVTDDEEMVEN